MKSHRLFVTLTVDRILVLEHGRLVEEGTHQQLMKLDGVYAEMFKFTAHRSNRVSQCADIHVRKGEEIPPFRMQKIEKIMRARF